MEILFIIIIVIGYILSLVFGVNIIITKELTFKSGAATTENEAIAVGIILIVLSSYTCLGILWKAYKGMKEEETKKNKET